MEDGKMKEHEDRFTRAVDVIAGLIKDGKAYISLHPAGSCRLKVRDGHAVAEALKAKGISEETFSSIAREIPGFVYACLAGGEGSYIENRIERMKQRGEWKEERKDDTRNLLTRKLQIVREKLISEELKQRQILRQHAKAQYFVDLEWECRIKCGDSHEDVGQHIPYATMQVWYGGPSTGLEFPLQGPKDFAVDLTEQDIDHIISEFTAMKSSIQKLAKKDT
jgi:hypothetical protein